MQIETKTEHIHEIALTADEPFVIAGRDGEQISCARLIVSITTHDDGTVRPIQTGLRATGVALNKDGKPGRATRRLNHGNLNRLPGDILEAVLAEADRLGVTGLREDVAKTKGYLRLGSTE